MDKLKMKTVASLTTNPLLLNNDQKSFITEYSDIIEIRYDYYNALSLNEIRLAFSEPLLFTIREKKEKGLYTGSAIEKLNLFHKAGEKYDYIDCEYDFPLINDLDIDKDKLIISYHNFDETPKDIEAITDDIIDKYKDKSNHFKIVSYINHYDDIIRIKNLISKYKGIISAFGMGEKAAITRILGFAWGNLFTYGSISNNSSAAPGQITIKEICDLYKIKSLNQDTKVYGLVGNPVSQSKGKIIHNIAFQNKNKNAVYIDFLTEDISIEWDSLKSFVDGLSITMPHKEFFSKSCTSLNECLNSANTVVKKDNSFYYTNTDVFALEKLIKDKTANKNILILGSGGLAKACLYHFSKLGYKTYLWARNKDKVSNMLNENKQLYIKNGFSEPMINIIDEIEHITDYDLDIILQCTSVGFNNENESPIAKELLKKDNLIVESVMHPEPTKLIKEAKELGCKIINASSFFIEQAKLQYETWFNEKSSQEDYKKEYLFKDYS